MTDKGSGKFALTVNALGCFPSIDISKERFEEIKSASENLSSLLDLEEQ